MVSKTASLRLLNPELTWLNPAWKKLRVVVMTSSAEFRGSAVVVEIVVERMVVDGVEANVVATDETDDAVLLMRRSRRWPVESSAEIPGMLSDRLGLLIHSASGGAKNECGCKLALKRLLE